MSVERGQKVSKSGNFSTFDEFPGTFGRGASKSTTQGGIFDLNMYVTFDCAGIAAF